MSSNPIYNSYKAVPYVYKCTNKETGQFYFGYRSKNVRLNLPSSIDFINYKSSLSEIRQNFDQYSWEILAEFFTETSKNDAYDLEQLLIFENWGNEQLLNKSCFYQKNRFKLSKHKEETKLKISMAQKGKPKSAASTKKMTETIRKQYLDGKISPKSGIPQPKDTICSECGVTSTKQNIARWHNENCFTVKKRTNTKIRRPQTKIKCPHCGKEGGICVMQRHHMDNCKLFKS
jgi:hypothetical protein